MKSTDISASEHKLRTTTAKTKLLTEYPEEFQSSTEETNAHSLAATIAAAASGGVTGATIGRLLGGKTGATIGAVVGGVAGVAVFSDEEHIAQAKSGIVETAKDASDRVKALAADARHSVADVKHKVVDVKHKTEEATPPTGFVLPARVHHRLGVVLGREGKLREAIQELREALDLAPNSAVTHYNLGVAFSKRGDVNRGLRYLKQARKLCLEQGRTRQAKVVARTIKNVVNH
jgi:tetratricopeptide (TPR) repeat protein